jgi:hypothetical protein
MVGITPLQIRRGHLGRIEHKAQRSEHLPLFVQLAADRRRAEKTHRAVLPKRGAKGLRLVGSFLALYAAMTLMNLGGLHLDDPQREVALQHILYQAAQSGIWAAGCSVAAAVLSFLQSSK